MSKQYLRPAADTDQEISLNDKYLHIKCKHLTISTDIKYFGWMKKDNE